MPTVSESIMVKASPDKVFEVITDFKNYPKFQEDIESTKIIKSATKSARVFFIANIMQKVEYTLDFKFSKPTKVEWKLSGDHPTMKVNNGCWTIQEIKKGVTNLNFETTIEFKIWIPDIISRGIIKSHLPKMLEAMKLRAEKKRGLPCLK